jgi:hypothetical protein
LTARRLWPVLVLAAMLSMAHTFATPAFWPVDETSHVAYADHVVTTGRLPEIDTAIPLDLPYPGVDRRLAWERDELRDGRQDIWTSNHPPFPYLIQGVALRTGLLVGGGGLGLLLARLTSVAWLVGGVWASMQLAFLLAPTAQAGGRRRLQPHEVAYAAGTVVAVTGTLSHLGGLVFNDAPAFTMSTLCLFVGARAAFAGLTPRRLMVVGVIGGLAARARVSCLPAVGVMVLLAAYGLWRAPAALLRASGRAQAIIVAGLSVVPAAVFWLRNIALYGDITGTDELFDKFNRDLNDPVSSLIGDRLFWLKLWNRMLDDLTTGHWAVSARATITEAVLVAVLIGLAAAVVRAVRRTVVLDVGQIDLTAVKDTSPGGRLAGALRAHPRRVVWAVGALLPLTLLVTTVQFHAAGGSLHGRYALGGHALVATAMVLCLGAIPAVGRYAAIGVALPLFVVDAALVQALLLHHVAAWSRPDITLVLPYLAGTRGPGLAVLCVLVAAAALVVVLAQHRRWRTVDLEPRSRRPGRYGVTPPIRSIKESAAR